MKKDSMPRRKRPQVEGSEPVLRPGAPYNLVVESISYQITSQSVSAPPAGGPIMPEGFLTETGLLRFW